MTNATSLLLLPYEIIRRGMSFSASIIFASNPANSHCMLPTTETMVMRSSTNTWAYWRSSEMMFDKRVQSSIATDTSRLEDTSRQRGGTVLGKNVENLADEQIGTQIMVRFELYVYDVVLGGYGLDDIVVLQVGNQRAFCRWFHRVKQPDGNIP